MNELAVSMKENLNDFYIKTLVFSERIRDRVPEKKNLYLDAFFGLMRNGYPYEIEEKYPEKKHHLLEDKKSKKNKKTEESLFDIAPELGGDPVRTILIKIDDTYYKCPEVDLQYAFGSLYEKVTAVKKKKHKKETDDAFFLPDIYSDSNTKDKDNNTETDTGNADAPAAEEAAVIPYVPFDPRYENDGADFKEYDSFLFNFHETHVRYMDGTERVYQSYIYPLMPDTSDCLATDIVAIMIDPDGNVRPGISEPGEAGQKSVTEEFKDITFIVRGQWEDGKFVTSINLYKAKGEDKPLVHDPDPKTVMPTRRTSSFYLRHIEDNGNVLNVFPLGLLRNDARTGLAPCVLMLEDGKTRTMYMSGDNNPVAMTFNRKSVFVSSFWAGNSLNLSIDVKR